jgi:hypothetical protein
MKLIEENHKGMCSYFVLTLMSLNSNKSEFGLNPFERKRMSFCSQMIGKKHEKAEISALQEDIGSGTSQTSNSCKIVLLFLLIDLLVISIDMNRRFIKEFKLQVRERVNFKMISYMKKVCFVILAILITMNGNSNIPLQITFKLLSN